MISDLKYVQLAISLKKRTKCGLHSANIKSVVTVFTLLLKKTSKIIQTRLFRLKYSVDIAEVTISINKWKNMTLRLLTGSREIMEQNHKECKVLD